MALSSVFYCCSLVILAAASNVCHSEDGSGCLEDVAASFVQMAKNQVRGSRENRSIAVDSVQPSKDQAEGNTSRMDANSSKHFGYFSAEVNTSKVQVNDSVAIVNNGYGVQGQTPETPGSGLRFRVATVDCHKMSKPLQVVLAETGYTVMELDVVSGGYTPVFDIPFDVVEGGYTELNACGINPVDSHIYCTMFAEGAYIVRLDPSTMEFVARLPWAIYNTGGFAASGTMFVATGRSWFVIVKDLDKAKGFPEYNRNSPKIMDLRKASYQKPTGFGSCADVVPVDVDLQGNGIEEYIFVLYGPKLQIAKWDAALEKFTETWIVPVNPARWDYIYGAGWNFGGKVYFAANGGQGVWEVPLNLLTLKEGFADGFKLDLKKIGNSSKIAASDGMNCMGEPSPWGTDITPFDCGAFPGPIQALIHDDGYDIKFLEMDSGNYSMIYTVYKNMTTPAFKFLNAFSISPMDYIVYASLVMDDWDMSIYPTPPVFYVVRMDKKKIEFIAKVQAPFGSPIAGTFDKEGNFYIISNPSLLTFNDVGSMTGYKTHDDPALPFYGPESEVVSIRNMSGTRQIADIVAITGNLDGKGDAKWVLSANAYMQLICMKPEAGEYYIIETNDVLKTDKRQNFGAGWNFMGQVYFSSNDGAGVFEVPLDSIDVLGGNKINLDKVGESAPIYNNDGMNCIRTYSPFSKKAGTYVEPFGASLLKGVKDLAMSLLGWLFI